MTVRAVRRALLSVSDKTHLLDLARGLAAFGVELVSTGGTRKALADGGLAVREVSELTGFAETIAKHDIQPIDLVVVNLYPFEATVARAGSGHEEIIENIDIGGPAMVRS